jgi:hypothetical protein
MAFIPGGTTAFNGSAGAFVAMSATSVPNRRLFVQPSQRMRISLDGGTNYGIVGAQDTGRAHDLGITNPNTLSIKSDTSTSGNCYWWTLDAGES